MSSDLVSSILTNLSEIIDVDNTSGPLIKGCIESALAEYNSTSKVKKSRTTKAKSVSADGSSTAPKPQNPYNYYVRVQMEQPEIQAVDPKGRMTEIGRLWKLTSDEEKTVYKSLADPHNAFTQEQLKTLGSSYDKKKDSLDAVRHAYQSNPRFHNLVDLVGRAKATKPKSSKTSAVAGVSATATDNTVEDEEFDDETVEEPAPEPVKAPAPSTGRPRTTKTVQSAPAPTQPAPAPVQSAPAQPTVNRQRVRRAAP